MLNYDPLKMLGVVLFIYFMVGVVVGDIQDECGINPDTFKIRTDILSGDEINIYVTLENAGSSKCYYTVYLYDKDDVFVEESGYLLRDLDSIFPVKPGESETYLVSSNWDYSWDVCRLDGDVVGKGKFFIDIKAKSKETGLDDNVVIDYEHTFDTIDECCGEEGGVVCFNYTQNFAGFTCDETVQINQKSSGEMVGCLVDCGYDDAESECVCTLEGACAIECVSGDVSYCKFDDFICQAPNYHCPGGSEPEEQVRCSTTENCKYQCAGVCGKQINCNDDCESCCTSICNSRTPAYGKEVSACVDTCMGMCETKRGICDIIEIIDAVAAGIATFVVVLGGIKWMIAEDYEGRKDVKSMIVYAFLGLLVVVLSVRIVNYFMGGSFVC